MIHFTPTFGIKDTGKNAKAFIKENMPVFWNVLKPMLPYIVILYAIDMIITAFFMPIDAETGESVEFALGSIIAGYFYTCIAITWHRVVIHGADKYEAMNPFKPRKSELTFIGMGIALFLMMFIVGFIIGFGAAIINPVLLILLLPLMIAAVYLWMRVIFYFPAKATGNHISFKQSFSMTDGYVWKIFAGYFVTAFKTILIMIGYLIAGFTVLTGILIATTLIGIESKILEIVLGGAFMLPIIAFFQPLFAVIWVTVLSNYYQYVMQNDAPPVDNASV